jgi:hypothetical protein
MQLFDVADGQRVRLTAKTVRWVERGAEMEVGQNVTFEGTTTDAYFTFRGVKRRLIVDHTIPEWGRHGTWQRDCECELIE